MLWKFLLFATALVALTSLFPQVTSSPRYEKGILLGYLLGRGYTGTHIGVIPIPLILQHI
jgi:hypothetical protein